MAQVLVDSLRKGFGASPVLESVSLKAADGEFLCILGPSGCGKTTLLRIVAGLETADGGSVRIGDRDVAGLPPKDRDIAMVFQSYALYPHMDAASNIGLALRLRGVPAEEIKRRVAEAASRLGLDGLLERKPAALSGGQRQRVALARALVRRPRAYLLDEPLSNLDAVLRERTRGELKLLFKAVRGTVLYVTHDQVEAMTLSDRIVVLDRGRVRQAGSPRELYAEPADLFVAGFIGAPPMNILDPRAAAAFGVSEARLPKGARLGVRPEDVEVSLEEDASRLEAEVELFEPLGSQTLLALRRGGERLRACLGGLREPRAKAWVRLPPEKLHYFDAGSGRRLKRP